LEVNKKKRSFSFYIFILGFLFLLGAIAFAGYVFFFDKNNISSEKINISFNVEENVKGGAKNTSLITIVNNNDLTLKNAKLKITYQKGFSGDGVIDLSETEMPLGDLIKGQMFSTSTSYVFVGKEGDVRDMKLNLTYSVEGQNGLYNKEINREVKIVNPSVLVTMDSIDRVIGSNDFTFNVKVKNIDYSSDIPLVLKLDLPNGISVKMQNSNPSSNPSISSTTSNLTNISNSSTIELRDLSVSDERSFIFVASFKTVTRKINNIRANILTYENNQTKSLVSDTNHEIEIIDSPITYKIEYESNGSPVSRFKFGQNNFLKIILKNEDMDLIRNIDIIAEKNNVKSRPVDESSLIKINPGQEIESYINLEDLTSGENKYTLEFYGTLRGETNSVLLKKETLTFIVE
jgi:hypothetical protein